MRARFFLPLALVLLLCAPARAEPPQIFWASDPVKPGETVLMVGSDLDTPAKITVRRLDDTGGAADAAAAGSAPAPAAAGVDVAGVDVAPLLTTAQSLMVPIPADMAPGVYRLRLTTAQGAVEQVVNAPAVYWSQGDLGADAAPGGTVRVFGRDIARTPAATLTLAPEAGGAPLVLPAAQGGLWDARFDLPATLAPGRYALTLWNGHGDRTARADAGTMLIRVPAAAPSRVVTLSPTRTGTNRDDTARIQAALDELGRAGGGTLKLTRGRFAISAGLVIPQFVTVEGEERDMTSLALADGPNPPLVLISGQSDFTLKDFAILAGNHSHIISGGFDAAGIPIGSGNITIDSVMIRASMFPRFQDPEETKSRYVAAVKIARAGVDAVRLTGENITVARSDILSSMRPFFLSNAKHAYIHGNKFYNGRLGWYSITRSQNVIFEGNAIIGADLQSGGGGVNTLYQNGSPTSNNVVFKSNSFERMMGGDRESMTTDGLAGCYSGPVILRAGEHRAVVAPPALVEGASAGPAFDPAVLKKCLGAGLMVFKGRGAGQVRMITAVDGLTLTLDRPLQTGSDADTTAIVGGGHFNMLYVDNTATDTNTAGQFYGTMVNGVMAGNTGTRTTGFQARALKYGTVQSLFFLQFLDNRVNPVQQTHGFGIEARATLSPDMEGPHLQGLVIRNNALLGNASVGVFTNDPKRTGIRDVLIEGNRIERADVGIYVSGGVANVLLRDNSFKDNIKDVLNLAAPAGP